MKLIERQIPNIRWIDSRYTKVERLSPQIPSKKYTRYAMIKGWVERHHVEKRPISCKPLSEAAIEGIYQLLKGK
jgi:hypothetical protein